MKTRFYETNNIFYFKNWTGLWKKSSDPESTFKIKAMLTWILFRKFAYVSSYLKTEIMQYLQIY